LKISQYFSFRRRFSIFFATKIRKERDKRGEKNKNFSPRLLFLLQNESILARFVVSFGDFFCYNDKNSIWEEKKNEIFYQGLDGGGKAPLACRQRRLEIV
jgi:hypothetical protein